MSIRESRLRLGARLAFVTAVAGLLAARIGVCAEGTTSATDTAIVVWDEALLAAVRVNPPGPTIVARGLAVLHTSMFDAWAAYDTNAVPTTPRRGWRRPAEEATNANKLKAVSYAAYRAAVDLFPNEKARFDSALRGFGYDPSDTSTDPATPSGVGNLAASGVLELRHRDGSNQLGDLHTGAYSDTTGYQAVNTPTTVTDPNRWQPLTVVNSAGQAQTQVYTTPHWGNVIPFALTSGSALRPGPPATYPSQAYADQAAEIIALSAGLNDIEKVTAEYFADGPSSEFPPGHWALFAQFVSRRDAHSLDDDVKMFFALSNSLLDASICVWDAKRAYDFRETGNGDPLPIRRSDDRGLGRPVPGDPVDPRRRLAALSALDREDSPFSGVLLRAQRLLGGGSRDPEELHGQRRFR